MMKESTNKNKGLIGGAAVVQSNDKQQDNLQLNAEYNLEKANEQAKFDNNVPKRSQSGGKKKIKSKKRNKSKKIKRRIKSKSRRKRMYKLRFSKMVPLKF